MKSYRFKVSGLRSKWTQLLIWDPPLGNHGHVRNVIGNLVEDLTAALIDGHRHKTDSRAEYCPDVSADNVYYESKAAGRSRQTFIYSGRLIKDRLFTADYNLKYVIWHHQAETKTAKTVGELERLILRSMRSVYIVPFSSVDTICSALAEEKLNSKYGGTCRKTYGSGYRISIKLLSEFMIAHLPYGLDEDFRSLPLQPRSPSPRPR